MSWACLLLKSAPRLAIPFELSHADSEIIIKDATKKDHLRASVRQLRDEFRSQRQDHSGKDSKELRKEYKTQRKEIKKEIKAVVKEAKANLKADRKM